MLYVRWKEGRGRGNWGHAGRKGLVGGSQSTSSGVSPSIENGLLGGTKERPVLKYGIKYDVNESFDAYYLSGYAPNSPKWMTSALYSTLTVPKGSQLFVGAGSSEYAPSVYVSRGVGARARQIYITPPENVSRYERTPGDPYQKWPFKKLSVNKTE